MTEHLPECWAKDPSDPPAWCICDELRACERRMLDAAREAVAAIEIAVVGNSAAAIDQAIAAIGALRGESHE